ncbi:protein RRP5 homolog [Cimex lectularius]|uniref:S1 motif domain-containing protein n=1 Tax=Cimex lectularius TaxID=79782 RepID=A0A8I6REC3_CIMLE|nr:protein RRP5 homolog [Cimex lectularius]
MVSIQDDDDVYFPRGGNDEGKERSLKRKGTFIFDKRVPKKKLKAQPGKRERERMKKSKVQNYASLPSIGHKNVEFLKYPVPEGTLLMCCVVEIHPNSLSVKLPNRISAKIHVKDISQPLNNVLNEKKKINLHKMFTVGNCYPCKRISSPDSRDICVTMNPAAINSELNFTQVFKGMLIIGAVSSETDHGYTIFTGIPGVIAFLSNENASVFIEQMNKKRPLCTGQLVWCKVVKCKLSEQTNIIEVSAHPDAVGEEVTSRVIPEMLIPGATFNATVDEVKKNAVYITLNNSCLGGFILHSHLLSPKLSDYKAGTDVSVGVLYKYPFSELTAFSMTIKPHSVLKKEIKDGTLLERAKILEVNARGVMLQLNHNEKIYRGMITHRRLSNMTSFEEKVDRFPVGNHISVRVLGYDYIEPMYSCSNEDDILHEKIITTGNIKVGQIVNVVIVEKQHNGYVGTIGKLRAFIPSEHVSDDPGSAHFLKIGSKKEGRVLKIQDNYNTAIITLNPLLLSGPALKSLKKVSQGEAYYGTITGKEEEDIKVTFFKGITVNINSTNLIKDIKQYTLGETVKCYVFGFKKGYPEFSLLKSVDQSNLSIGKQYTLIITEIKKEGIICLGKEKNEIFKADLPLHHLSDHPELWNLLLSKYKLGDTVSDAFLFNYRNGRAVFSLRESVCYFFKKKKNIVSKGVKALETDMILPCTISINNSVMKVSVPVPMFNKEIYFNLEDHTNDLNSQYTTVYYYNNQPASLQVKQYNKNNGNIELYRNKSTYPDEKWAVNNLKSFLGSISQFQQFQLGDTLNVIVQSVDKSSKATVGITESGKKVCIYSDKNLQPKSKLNVVVLFDDVLNNVIHTVPSSQIEKDEENIETSQDKHPKIQEVRIIFGNSLLMIGWIKTINKFAYIPSKGVLNSLKVNFFAKGFQEIKILCHWKSYCIGYPCKKEKFTSFVPKHITTENAKLLPFKNTPFLKLLASKAESTSNDVEDSTLQCDVKGSLPKQEKANLSKRKKASVDCGFLQQEEMEVDSGEENSKKRQQKRKRKEKNVDEFSEYLSQDEQEINLLQMKRYLTEPDLAQQIKQQKWKVLDELSLMDVGGFDFNATPSDLTKVVAGDLEESADEESEEEKLPKKKLTPAERKAAMLEAEKLMREKEEELLRADSNPQSADHFDRILLGEPNNSKRWIQYMAFHLQTADFDKARSVAKRALKTINMREEQEKQNVWIALLNLDHTYSPPEVFQETLTEALKFNDDYAINSRVLDMYAESGKTVEVEQLANQLVRKYRDRMDCWLHCQGALMTVGLFEKARAFLQRSLLSLQRKDHVTLISRFALLENKHGFPEQAHSLFENLLTSYPQRVDLWNVYVDMLVKSNRIDLARNVLERIKSHKLPVRKMKSLYNKWVSFEETYGTPKLVLAVKAAAEQYVNNVTSSGPQDIKEESNQDGVKEEDDEEEADVDDGKEEGNDDDFIDDDLSSDGED